MLLSMMALRRSRVLAFALLFLAPGFSGSAVQWLHACPVQTAAAGHHRNHGQAPADAGHSRGGCQCIGTCNTVGAASPATTVTVAAAVIRPDYHVVLPSGISFIPVDTPSDLLPPATAPPLLS
jgi:hypothetical protein